MTSSVFLKNGENKCFGQLELAHRVILSPCHCDDELKEMRKLFRKKIEEKVVVVKFPVVGMGLNKILELARDPFAFMWNVSVCVKHETSMFKCV